MSSPASAPLPLIKEVIQILLRLILSFDVLASDRVLQHLATAVPTVGWFLMLIVGDLVTIWDHSQFGLSSLKYVFLVNLRIVVYPFITVVYSFMQRRDYMILY